MLRINLQDAKLYYDQEGKVVLYYTAYGPYRLKTSWKYVTRWILSHTWIYLTETVLCWLWSSPPDKTNYHPLTNEYEEINRIQKDDISSGYLKSRVQRADVR